MLRFSTPYVLLYYYIHPQSGALIIIIASVVSLCCCRNSTGSSCYMLDWNYTMLAGLGYQAAQAYVSTSTRPGSTSCQYYAYDEEVPYSTTVSQVQCLLLSMLWNFMCKARSKTYIFRILSVGRCWS